VAIMNFRRIDIMFPFSDSAFEVMLADLAHDRSSPGYADAAGYGSRPYRPDQIAAGPPGIPGCP
jgi:hypothetical protein